MKKVIITGSTGLVGKGVLLECLEDPRITEILVINRSSVQLKHPKLKEVLLQDFSRLHNITDHLKGYDACFHCMGVSALGLSEEKYTQITYEISKTLVDAVWEHNPNMVFNYVSGTGTDSSEKGSLMWARVKGRTENMVFAKGFKDAYAFRPGAILPEKGIKSRTSWYNFFYILMKPFFPLMKRSKKVTTTTRLGKAMIQSLFSAPKLKVLHNPDINSLANKS